MVSRESGNGCAACVHTVHLQSTLVAMSLHIAPRDRSTTISGPMALTCPCDLVGLPGLLTLLDRLLSRPRWHSGFTALVGHLGSSLGGVYGLGMSTFIHLHCIC